MVEPPFEGRYRVNPASAMRRPRVCLARIRPGGPGQPSAPTTWGCLARLHAARTKAGESLPDRVSQKPLGSAPGSYGPGDRKAAMERREAPAFSKESAARRKTGAPLGAPSPLFRGARGRQATPAPRQRIRAMTCGCCLKIESVPRPRFTLPWRGRVASHKRVYARLRRAMASGVG
jgi:hypothetical protein